MNAAKTIAAAFDGAMAEFEKTEAMQLLASHRITLDQYKSVLREIFHYSKEDPQIQALAAVYFRGPDRAMVKMFFRHAMSEIGHDQLALNDIRELGVDTSSYATELPLPSTIALTSFPFYQIQYHNPIGYLGYLYFLEYMPTRSGAVYASALVAAGVPEAAMTFLKEHTTVDVGHNKLMQDYITKLVRNEADLSACVYALKVTGYLYGKMLDGAICRASDVQSAENIVESVRYGTQAKVASSVP